MIAVETRFGTVYHRELDAAAREGVSSAVSTWMDDYPQPEPPVIEPEWGVRERSRLLDLRQSEPGTHPDILRQRILDEAERVPNLADPDYQLLLYTWNERRERERFRVMLEHAQVIRPSTEDDPTRMQRELLIWKAIRTDSEACTAVYQSISFHSELTDRLLWHWIVKLDLRYRGQPFADAYAEREAVDNGGALKGAPPPLLERIGRMVVNRGDIKALIEMDDLPIMDQGKLAARMMWSAWCDSWDQEAARQKAQAQSKANRKQRQSNRESSRMTRWVPS